MSTERRHYILKKLLSLNERIESDDSSHTRGYVNYRKKDVHENIHPSMDRNDNRYVNPVPLGFPKSAKLLHSEPNGFKRCVDNPDLNTKLDRIKELQNNMEEKKFRSRKIE